MPGQRPYFEELLSSENQGQVGDKEDERRNEGIKQLNREHEYEELVRNSTKMEVEDTIIKALRNNKAPW